MSTKILQGDCRDILPTLPSGSVHCVVTSPPYYGLRDYGTAQWEGGDAGCDHRMKPQVRGNATYTNGQGGSFASNLQAWGDRDVSSNYRDICGKCGARRIDAQIGLEPTPAAFTATMVAVFRQVRRVLRDDGTVFCNMGDGYSDKQLLMMPARLALALQADGWWIRSDIIWAKPNPMPESVTDRPTSAHEHVFLLSKSARYFYDADAVREDGTIPAGTLGAKGSAERASIPGVNSRPPEYKVYDGTRNLRNVWSVATEPFSGSHFATMPTEIVSRCIRAGTSERGCCAACGAPWVRVVDTSYERNRHGHSGRTDATGSNGWDGGSYPNLRKLNTTTGWSPGCQCGAATVPAVVLDPFAGAGTTLLVADRLQRDGIAIELSPAYCAMLRNRILSDAPLLAEVAD